MTPLGAEVKACTRNRVASVAGAASGVRVTTTAAAAAAATVATTYFVVTRANGRDTAVCAREPRRAPFFPPVVG